MRLHLSVRESSTPSGSPQPSPISNSFNQTHTTIPHTALQSTLGSLLLASHPADTNFTPPRTPHAFYMPNHQPHRDTATWPAHPAPPIVVPSAHWTADVQTFMVRTEPNFTVYCTVVRPVPLSCASRLWNWLTGTGSQPRTSTPNSESCTNEYEDNAVDEESDAELEAPGDDDDDDHRVDTTTSPSLHARPCQRPAGSGLQPQHASRRYSGWNGVFSLDAHSADDIPAFVVDDASGRLLVPDMDVGVEHLVREEHEDLVPLGTTAAADVEFKSGSDTDLDLDLGPDHEIFEWWAISE